MKIIRKTRREYFGGIIFSENPGLLAYIGNDYADKLGIPKPQYLSEDIFSAPLDVHMRLNTKCNLHCKGCYSINSKTPELEMDFDLAKSIIDNFSCINVFTVALGGGEPLLYPKVFELATYIRKQNIAPNLTTNGICLDKVVAKQCKVFTNIHLSLHTMNDLSILQPAINNLSSEGIVPGLNILMTTETFPYLDGIFTWASKNQITKVLLLQFKLTDINREYESMQLSHEQQIKLFPIVEKLSRKFGIVLMIDCSMFPLIAIHKPKRKELEFYDVNGCQGGNMYIAVDVDGSYKPCSFCSESLGEAISLTPQEWRNNTGLNYFRHKESDKLCEKCAYFKLCNGGCNFLDRKVCQK